MLFVKVNGDGYGQFDHNGALPPKVNAERETDWHRVYSPMRQGFRFDQLVGSRHRLTYRGDPWRRGDLGWG